MVDTLLYYSLTYGSDQLIGFEKKYTETNPLKRTGYALVGELAIPGRLRAYHLLRRLRDLGFMNKEDLHVLDAGCGRGDMSVHLAKRFPSWQICGVDLNEERLGIAKSVKGKLTIENLEYFQENLVEFKPAEKPKLLYCLDVLEHIEDDVAVMENFYDILADDGLMVLTFPSVPQRKHLGLVEWKERRMGIDPLEAAGHVRQGYSIEGIESTLREIGFRDVEAQYTFGFWGTLCFDLYFVIGDNKPNPLLYALAFPWLMTFAWLDVWFPSKQGSALLVVARK